MPYKIKPYSDRIQFVNILRGVAVILILIFCHQQSPFTIIEYIDAIFLFFIFWYFRVIIEKKLKLFHVIANISYPFYVIHGVAGYALIRILLDLDISPAVSLTITIIIALILSCLIHKYIEIPTQKLGKKLSLKV